MLEAYCWPPSVDPGEPTALCVSSDAPAFDVTVTREGANRQVVWRARDVASADQPIPDDASAHGCRWSPTLEIPVDVTWRSGYYGVTLAARGERAEAFLVIRPAPDRPSPILLVLSTATWNAYNDWGGAQLYTGGTQVSFDRPLAPGFLRKPEPARRKMQPHLDAEALWFFEWAEPLGLSPWSGGAGWYDRERPFLAWAETQGFDVDVAISQDLQSRPDVLDGHRLFLSVGHDEYWSWGMRDALEVFTGAGGNAAIFSGNTCYWQVRFEDDLRTMVGFKYDADADPVVGTDDERFLTGAWVDRRIGRPEFTTTGLSFSRGGYARYGLATPRSSGGYTVWRPEHWAFDGTGLMYGDALGTADTIVAYEVDGCDLTLANGRPVPTHRDGAPDGLEVLATAPAHLWTRGEQPTRYAREPGEAEPMTMAIHGDGWRDHLEDFLYGHAVLGCFTTPGGGIVFNAGVTDWTYGLTGGDPDVATITRNVLGRLSA
jgi:hypothetical protein